jgi:hypothetical protein
VVAAVGWWRTAPDAGLRSADAASPLVDTRALATARRLAAFATTAAEQDYANRAVGAADHVLDLEFAQALRDAAGLPPPATPEVRQAQARLEEAARQLVADNDRIAALRAATEVTPPEQRSAIDAELAVAEAEYEIHQYQFGAADRALTAAGGNLRARIETLVAEHRAAGGGANALPAVVEEPVGLIGQLRRAWSVHRKAAALDAARDEVESARTALVGARGELAGRVNDEAATGASSAERLAAARERASLRRTLAATDERIAAHLDLRQVYDEWRAYADRQVRQVWHGVLRSVALIAGILLALLLAGRAIGHALGRLPLDRRQAEALRTVAMVALQVIGVLLIAFVLIGPPTQLGTVIGLATAGLTVALKDFIVAFAGWFVLMGRNGIRVGDWVEIRGVAGEVVELGMFHTVLLETGNWTDTGHPTGRRVTFTNSYAIEGHYFNFSTSGQWLWDTLSVVVPNGGDLYGFVGTLTDTAKTLTEQSAREAEAEWQRAARTRKLTGLSAEPAVRLKPVVGGTEVSVRYITRADERYRLRSELYAVAVQRLGVAPVPG